MLLLAQLPTASSAELGTLLAGLAALAVLVGSLLGTALAVRQLFWPVKPSEQWAATRGELAVLEKTLSANEASMKTEMGRLEKSLATLQDYTHESVHALRNGLQTVQLQLVTMGAELRKDVERTVAAVETKVDRLTVSMARVQTLLEQSHGPATAHPDSEE